VRGVFTRGGWLDDNQAATILAFRTARAGDNAATIANLQKLTLAGSGEEGIGELAAIAALTAASGYAEDQVLVDPSVVRGLEYYTGPVFEVELTFEVRDEDGRNVRFGSVAGGGRYDGLVGRFRDEPVPATGFSIGVSRLIAALTHLGKVSTADETGPVVVVVLDRDQIASYQKLTATLRQAGIRAEMYLGSAGMNAQMKYADRRNSPCAVIQGSNEREAGEVQIKDLKLGATLRAIKDRSEYLAQQAEAQFSVRVEDLVAGVRRVLDRAR
jgi:histidyl-tRNA synthetase